MKKWFNLVIIFLCSPYHFVKLLTALCPMRCNCNDERLVAFCNNSFLDVVPITLNPELKELYLSNNQIKSIFSSFTVYRDLEFLDMSQNSMTTLGKKNFAAQRHLRVMLIGRNLISEINNLTFYGLSSLQLLHLNDNMLEELPHRVFAGLNKLEKLDLSRNGISSIYEEAFSGLINLKSLLLRDNKLKRIPTQSFSHLPNLVKLDLGINSFAEIPEFAFSSLTSLQDLSLDSCSVASIPETAFEHLDHLRLLQIQDNHLRRIPTEAMENLKNLEELIISKNKMKIIEAFAFRGMTNLKILVISSVSQLEFIDRDALLENPYLKKIILEFNEKLRHLSLGTFDVHSGNLKYLSLRGNQIETLHPRLFQWEQLEYFDIRENPLNCNCSLVWLWKYLKKSNFTTKDYLDHVQCAEPSNLIGHSLLSIPSSELGCYESRSPQLITGSVIIAVICAICCIFIAITCRARFAFFINKKKYDPALYPTLADDLTYEKGRIIDNQVMCSPTTAIMIKPPIKIAPITEL